MSPRFRGSLSRRVLLAGALAVPALRRARAATVLRMGDQRGNIQALMQAAGVLDGLPYRLEWSQFAAAAPLLEAVGAGAVDGGNVGDAPFTFAFAAGAPIRAIATRRSSQYGTAIVVPGASGMKTVADLRGKRIATVRGSVGHFLVLATQQRYRMAPADMHLTFLQPADAHAAIAAGAVDAWSTWEPYTSQYEVVDHGRILADGQGVVPGLGYHAASLAAIGARRDELADFRRRLIAAHQWEQAHKAQYAATWAKLMDFPEAVPQHWFARTDDRIVGVDAGVLADEQRIIDLYAQAGLLARRFEAKAMYDTSFDT